MSLSAKREARIYGRYARAGRPHKTRILDEFCAPAVIIAKPPYGS